MLGFELRLALLELGFVTAFSQLYEWESLISEQFNHHTLPPRKLIESVISFLEGNCLKAVDSENFDDVFLGSILNIDF